LTTIITISEPQSSVLIDEKVTVVEVTNASLICPTYVFQEGITDTSGIVKNDLITGKAGGQTIIGGTENGDNLILASTTAATKGKIYFGQAQNAFYDADLQYFQVNTNAAGTAQTLTSGCWYQNNTPAALGLQQISPSTVQEGQGWATTSSASMSVKFQNYVIPVQGSASPTGNWVIQSSLNNAAFTNILTLTSAGALTVTGAFNTSSTVTGTTFISSTTSGGNAFISNATATNANLVVIATGTASGTTSQLLFAGATTVNYRMFMRGSTSTVLAANTSYAAFIIGGMPITAGTSGTHAMLAQQVIKPSVITAGVATITNTAALYIEGAATATVTGVNFAFYSAAGANYMGGKLTCADDVELTTVGKGIIVKSPDGARWRLTPSNAGVSVWTAL
jgi:hypothetical protein